MPPLRETVAHNIQSSSTPFPPGGLPLEDTVLAAGDSAALPSPHLPTITPWTPPPVPSRRELREHARAHYNLSGLTRDELRTVVTAFRQAVEIIHDDRYCRRCGAEISVANRTVTCPNCGHLLELQSLGFLDERRRKK